MFRPPLAFSSLPAPHSSPNPLTLAVPLPGLLRVVSFTLNVVPTYACPWSPKTRAPRRMPHSASNTSPGAASIQHHQEQHKRQATKREDLEGTETELDAAMAHFDKLKPSYVDSRVSHEDRVARRKKRSKAYKKL